MTDDRSYTLARGERYYLAPAAAHVRASLPGHRDSPDGELLRIGLAAGVRLSAFKRSQPLPRVGAVLGALRSIRPTDLLDVGSGRGVFLWPLLDAFPDLTVTAAEIDGHRAGALALVTRGGLERLRVVRTDVQALGLTTDSFDVVTFLEVLEHLREPRVAAREAVRVARRFVVLSVPSRPDSNPQHLHLFAPDDLRGMLADAGARRVTVSHVLNHRVVVATL